jgi:hypothetical protein
MVGISPFGIWRPGHPPGIVGLDQYSSLYADARLWLQQGWLDYFTPQLYWPVESKGQSYGRLLGWWAEQNVKGRHLWPGNFTSKVRRGPAVAASREAWSAEELLRQIEVTRATPGATGNVHFSMKALMHNYDGIADKLKAGLYAEPALVPQSPWLGNEMPPKPTATARRTSGGVSVEMRLPGEKSPWQWVVQTRANGDWKTAIVPGRNRRHVLRLADGEEVGSVFVSAVTRLGRVGRPARAEIDKRD